jgi:surface antigen
MGAKLVGPKGKGTGKGKKGGGNVPLNTGLVSVNLTVSVAKALLGSLNSGIALSPNDAKIVSLAVVRALSTGPISKKKSGKKIGKKVVGKKVA